MTSRDIFQDVIARLPERDAQAELVHAFRRSVVLVPLVTPDALVTSDLGGVRWVLAFTTREELARFAVAGRPGDPAAPDAELRYATVRGWRLLEAVVPAIGVPAGVAVDVAGAWPVLLPPAPGIVPPAVAVTP